MNHDCPVISEALQRAINKNVIVVASAPNRGHDPISFPAKYDRVFCIGTATGHGAPAPYNPRGRKKEKFCALGEGVQVTWTTGPNQRSDPSNELERQFVCKNGSSAATIVAAGIAALYIDFTRQFCNLGEGADNFENMHKLFHELSKQTAGQEYPVLIPWSLFRRHENPKEYIKEVLFKGR